jgi:chromosomal replication initiation ATPase DnaA
MIIAQVCDRHGVAVDEVMGRSRYKRICLARKEAYAMLREEKLSFPTIARMFGRDHTTVVDGVQRHRRDQYEGTQEGQQEPCARQPEHSGKRHDVDRPQENG